MKKLIFLAACIVALLIGCYLQPQTNNQSEPSIIESINKDLSTAPSAIGKGKGHYFYIDPVNGSMENPGTSDFPWLTLEQVVKSNLIETKDQHGTIINQDAPVRAGDTLILRSGFHGHVQIKNAYNDKKITVISDDGADAQLAELELMSVKNWRFDGLTISPAFSDKAIRTSSIVNIGDNGYLGNTSHIEILNSHIFTFLTPPESLSKDDWKQAKTGILFGRKSKHLRARNNYIESTSFGISGSAPESIIEGNVVTDFSKDGIRLISSNTIVKYNVVKNNYAIDDNHDDGIQGFSYNGVDLTNSSLIGNVILNRDKNDNPFPGIMQGIGFFDGPFYNFLLQNNVILCFTWQGLAVYDSVGGKIQGNFLYTPSEVGNNVGTRITLGTKNKGVDIENLLAGNVAHQYILNKNDLLEDVLNLDIDEIKEDSDVLFMKKLNNMLAYINSTYGEVHDLSNKTRVNEEFLNNGPSYLFD